MKYEETIKKIDFLIDGYQMLIDKNIGNGDVVGHDVRGTWQSETSCIDAYKDLINACKTAEQAVEKQIPKKPIFRYEKIGRENVCVSCCCPNPKCNNTSLGNNEYMFDYCEECGQRLDWSDENE